MLPVISLEAVSCQFCRHARGIILSILARKVEPLSITAKRKATVSDLYSVPDNGKAELVNGELVIMSPTGFGPGRASGEIYFSLRQYEQVTGSGYACPDNIGFIVDMPDRQSFSPDAAYYIGPDSGMRFAQGAPAFAVEVRSEEDYGPAAQRSMRDKRADYFAAGTQVVWDVDLLGDDVIRSFRSPDPDNPAAVFHRSETADAEPTLPGWRFSVDDLFPSLRR